MPVLIAKMQVTDEQLVIDYELSNSSDRPYFAMVIPKTIDGSYLGNAYRSLAPDRKSLSVLLGVPPFTVPQGVSIGAKIIPDGVLVPPDDTLTGKLHLPLPVREWNAYCSLEDEASEEIVNVSKVNLFVDYVFEDDLQFCEKNEDGETFYANGSPRRRLSWGTELNDSIPVQLNDDEFDRF